MAEELKEDLKEYPKSNNVSSAQKSMSKYPSNKSY
jgi:hypothetical protein